MSKKDKKHKSSFLTDPLTRKRFKKELKAATRAEFRPLSRELASQKRISLLQSQRTSRYFKDYQQAIGRGRTAVQGAYNNAAQSMNNYAAAAGSQDAALRAQLGQQASADASLYGGSGDTGAANLALLGSANRVRAGADVAGAIQGQGANTYGYLTSQKANAKLGRIEALNAEAANRRQISADKMDLLREKADFRNTYLADAREGERRYELALKELRNSNRQAAKDRNAAAALQNDQQNWDAAHPNANGDKKNSGQNNREHNKAVKDAKAALRSAPLDFSKIFSKNSKGQSVGIIAEYLRNEADVDAALARKLAKQYVNKHYTAAVVGGAIGGAGNHAGGRK